MIHKHSTWIPITLAHSHTHTHTTVRILYTYANKRITDLIIHFAKFQSFSENAVPIAHFKLVRTNLHQLRENKKNTLVTNKEIKMKQWYTEWSRVSKLNLDNGENGLVGLKNLLVLLKGTHHFVPNSRCFFFLPLRRVHPFPTCHRNIILFIFFCVFFFTILFLFFFFFSSVALFGGREIA